MIDALWWWLHARTVGEAWAIMLAPPAVFLVVMALLDIRDRRRQ